MLIDDLKQLKDWRDLRNPQLLERAQRFADWYCSICIDANEKLRLGTELWQQARNDLRVFAQILQHSSSLLGWQLIAEIVLVGAEIGTRYRKEIMSYARVLNWYSGLQVQNEWDAAFAVCAYECWWKVFCSSEALNLLLCANSYNPVSSRLLAAELLAARYDATTTDVFAAALEQLGCEPKRNESEPLRREARINRNPGGTGCNQEREIAESQLPLPEDAPSPLETAISDEADPAEVVADRDVVERAIARFGKRTADLLRLMLQGYTATEAAQELGISPATARKLLERARKQFSRNP
ncbi:MAG: hypothetical protein KatS3mg023_3458 [Armatimonadota bacterium]|nr:MAG: hypothetical protein KatS3mg023_3458 [Armatimonadota bacterium]